MKLILQSAIALSLALAANATTPQQAATRWAAFAPGMSGKIVYGDSAQKKICVLDLVAGATKQIAKYDLEAYETVYGSCCFRWSPSGKRIMTQNYDSVNVLNEDGTNFKLIAKANACCDMIWGDWDNDSAIVYSTGKTIVRTAIHTDNTPGATTVLVSTPPSGQGGPNNQGGYTCVGIYDGNWLTYIDYLANQKCCGGGHRPLLKNLKTGVVTKLIADKDDMCQLTNIPDLHYKTLGQMWSHLVPGTVCDTNGNHLVDSLPQIPNPKGGTYPQREYSWSNQLEYFMSQGENSSNQWAWIRSWSKRATGANIVVSDTGSMVMYFPDLWVAPVTGTLGWSGMKGGGPGTHRTPLSSLAAVAARQGVVVFDINGSAIDRRHPGPLPAAAGVYIVKVPGAGFERYFLPGK